MFVRRCWAATIKYCKWRGVSSGCLESINGFYNYVFHNLGSIRDDQAYYLLSKCHRTEFILQFFGDQMLKTIIRADFEKVKKLSFSSNLPVKCLT